MKYPKRVIIFLLSGVGDTLMFTPALRLMRVAWPKAHLVALTMRRSEYDALLRNPDLTEVRYWPFLEENAFSNLRYVAGLRREGFDLSILPCPSNRIHYNFIAFLAGARRRVAFRYLKQSRQNLDFLNTELHQHSKDVHKVEHNIKLVESLTRLSRVDVPHWTPTLYLPTDDEDREEAKRFLRREKLLGARFIGLHVSSSRAKHMERKCWPKEHFLRLIQSVSRRHPDLRFVLFCGPEDLPETAWLMERGGPHLHVAMRLPLRAAAEVIRTCQAFVSNDSGMLHVACAVQTSTVAIYGPTSPQRTGPWMAPAEVVSLGLPCSPCFYHTSRDLTCPADIDFACLRELPVESVVEVTERLLLKAK